MYDRYKIRTYQDNIYQENSDTDSENELDNIPFKKATYINDNIYPNKNINPSLMTKASDNISYYQSNINNTEKERKGKFKRIVKNISKNNYNIDIQNNPHNYTTDVNRKIQMIKNKIKEEEESKEINNGRHRLNQNVNLNKYFNLNESNVPKKSLKVFKNKYLDVEKSDNFNVLSYKQEDSEKDTNKQSKKSKLFQMFKKQETSELFFPSKRTKSPQFVSNNSAKKENEKKNDNKMKSSYQTPTLKFQSFYGSFTRQKNFRNLNQSKSTCKRTVNQLKDFNIDKLIEIGDNQDNKLKNILSFGNKIKDIRNKLKMRNEENKLKELNVTNVKDDMRYKIRTEVSVDNVNPNQLHGKKIELNSQKHNVLGKHNTNKKIVYHGQIKRKRNFKNNQEKIPPLKQEEINNSNILNKSINYNSNMVVKSRRINTYNVNNNNNNYINNSDNRNNDSIRSRQKNTKSNPKNQKTEFVYQSQNNQLNQNLNKSIVRSNTNNKNSLRNKKSTRKSFNNKKIDIIPNNETENNINSNTNQSNANNNKFHYSVKNFNDKKNNYDSSKYINHRTKNEDKILKETSNQKLLSEIKELNYIESNDNEIMEGNKSNSIKKDVIISEQKLRKTQNNPSSIVNSDMKNSYQKDFKNKRYYGYDDRHNLEGTINNHTIYVSVYTKKENKNN